MSKLKVLVVDDSALIRTILKEIINQSGDMEVVGTAADPYIARDKIRALNPDVITLDIEMPNMDGLEFLEKLMRLRPMPVLMVSTLTQLGSDATLRALELGAVDCIAKPKLDVKSGLENYAEEICEKIRAAAQANIHVGPKAFKRLGPLHEKPVVDITKTIIAIGASTGGTEAIKEVLMQMPTDCPPVVVVQHMPEGFTKSYAARLDSLCQISVKEAEDGDIILPGNAYLAPGGSHLTISRSSKHYLCRIHQEAPVNHHRPSVDVLFESVAKHAKEHAIGMILTGMGKDGASGLKQLHNLGCKTFAQDKSSCVVYGMPKEAIERGAADEVVTLDSMAQRLLIHLGYMQDE